MDKINLKTLSQHLMIIALFVFVGMVYFWPNFEHKNHSESDMSQHNAATTEIEKYRDQIKYCYEKEINADRPDLAGRVGIRFVIGPSGSVTSAGVSSSSLKNANSEGCIVEVIKRIQFPPVRGGGIAEVAYPFVFKPSNK